MRVLHVLDHSIPLQSGYVFRTMAIVREQKKIGITPILMTTPRHTKSSQHGYQSFEQIDNWQIYRANKKNSFLNRFPLFDEVSDMFATYKSIKQNIAAIMPDIIHVHSPILNFWPIFHALKDTYPIVYEIRAFWEDAAVNHGVTSFGEPEIQRHTNTGNNDNEACGCCNHNM